MSILSCSSDCLSDDLLCGEQGSGILSGESSPVEYSSDLDSSACSEESIAEFIEDERNFVPGFDYLARFRSQSLDASAREQSVSWILKVWFLLLLLLLHLRFLLNDRTSSSEFFTVMPPDRLCSFYVEI